MRSLILVLLLIPAAILPQNKNALALLDSVKAVYGNPCEIGVPSSMIERLRAYESEYIVKDYLNQYERINRDLSACKIDLTFSGNKRVKLDKLQGRERNAVNAAFLAFGALGAVVFDVVNLSNDLKTYYGYEYIFRPLDQLFVFHYSPDNDFYKALAFGSLKNK